MEKKNKTLLIGAIAAGAAVAGALTWLLTTESGEEALDKIKATLKDKGADFLAGVISNKTGIDKDKTRATTDSFVD